MERYSTTNNGQNIIDNFDATVYDISDCTKLLNKQQNIISRYLAIICDFHNRETAKMKWEDDAPLFSVDRYYRIALTDDSNLDELENLLNLCDDYNITLDSIYDMVGEYIKIKNKGE